MERRMRERKREGVRVRRNSHFGLTRQKRGRNGGGKGRREGGKEREG